MKIKVKSYKAIYSEREISVNGLTILSGANSAGKSSFMQPLLLLKQTLDSNYSTESLVLDGPNLKLTDSSQLISKVNDNQGKTFTLTIEDDRSFSYELVYSLKPKIGFIAESQSIRDKNFPNGLHIKRNSSSQGILNQIPSDIKAFPFSFFCSSDFNFDLITKNKKCFINIAAREKSKKPVDERSVFIEINSASYVENMLRRIIHVPGLRGNPERSYRKASSEGIFTGSFEQYVASIIKKWAEESSSRNVKQKGKFADLVKQLQKLGLANDIKAQDINDTRIEINVSRLCKTNKAAKSKDLVNIADVGFGVSQTLPVLVALLAAQKDSIVYIEQPELHLHPNAQFRLAEIVGSAIRRGVKVIIETHSSLFIKGIQISVARNEIPFEKVSLNWFTQNAESGDTEISSVHMDSLGRFGDWPVDFDDVTLYVENEYLNTIEESIFGQNGENHGE